MGNLWPSYRNLLATGELRRRARRAREMLAACHVCPRNCGVNRLAGELGFCVTTHRAIVASYNDHHGEEPCLTGTGGAGNIFFGSCNLRCAYCQNFPLSHYRIGKEVTNDRIAGMMLELERRGCHNINFVTPSHVVPQVIEAVTVAAEAGLQIPIVYNSSGYDSLESLKLLDGIVDIYLPDMKYARNEEGQRFSKVVDYVNHNRAAVREMWRQTGELELDEKGIARRGLMIRHLVLPNDLAGTREVLRFIAAEISPNVTLSLMNQYFPAHKALKMPELNRKITVQEYDVAVEQLSGLGLERGYVQETDYLAPCPQDV
ncbi:MAG: radical SAM protein [Acidobacteria bacterium]|nr:radical SAM protein [Acidobacteriota bacterium]